MSVLAVPLDSLSWDGLLEVEEALSFFLSLTLRQTASLSFLHGSLFFPLFAFRPFFAVGGVLFVVNGRVSLSQYRLDVVVGERKVGGRTIFLHERRGACVAPDVRPSAVRRFARSFALALVVSLRQSVPRRSPWGKQPQSFFRDEDANDF